MTQTSAEVAAAMLARRAEIADRITAEVTRRLDSYASVERSTVEDMSARAVDILIEAVGERRPLCAADRAALVDYGALRAAQGVALEDVYQAWRCAVRTLIDELVALAESDLIALRLTREILDRVDEATVSYTRGYHQADREQVRADEQLRSRFVLDLLHGRLGAQEIKRGAGAYGLDTGAEYCAMSAPAPSGPGRTALRDALTRATAITWPLITVEGDTVVGVVPPVDFLDVPFTVGLGPQVVLADLALSYRLASRARSTGEAYGSTGVQRFEALGLRLAVAGDPDVGEGFARTVFARLDAAESATALMETVRCHLELGARVEDTAAALFVHANTVRYRLSRFHELTGLDLRRPADAFRAWWAIEAEVMRNR